MFGDNERNHDVTFTLDEMWFKGSVQHPLDKQNRTPESVIAQDISQLLDELVRRRLEKSDIVVSEDCNRCREMAEMMFDKKRYVFPLVTIGVMLLILGASITLSILTALGLIAILNISSFFVVGIAALGMIVTAISAIHETEKVMHAAHDNIKKEP